MKNFYNIDNKLILFLILFCGILNAKSYAIDSLWVDSKIKTDGSVSISETRSFSFSGQYSYAYLELRKEYFDSIYDIQVFENDNIWNIVYSGKGVFEDPFYASYFYQGNKIISINKLESSKISVTNGSGRSRGDYTVVFKP